MIFKPLDLFFYFCRALLVPYPTVHCALVTRLQNRGGFAKLTATAHCFTLPIINVYSAHRRFPNFLKLTTISEQRLPGKRYIMENMGKYIRVKDLYVKYCTLLNCLKLILLVLFSCLFLSSFLTFVSGKTRTCVFVEEKEAFFPVINVCPFLYTSYHHNIEYKFENITFEKLYSIPSLLETTGVELQMYETYGRL